MSHHDRHIWDREPRRLASFKSAIRELVERFGLNFYLASVFPEADRGGLLENLITTNWPDDLLQNYRSTDMFSQSKIVAKLKDSVLPVSSSQLLFARAEKEGVASRIAGVFYDDGFACNLGVSLHDARGRQYLFMLSGSDFSEAELGDLVFDLMAALDDLTRGGRDLKLLSRREIECLRWSAAGKSSEEIAIILNLSSHTVTTYLKTAIRKLGVTTRIQASSRPID
ncbi:DNA-binding CsgD family transcriptional regulator [Rhizobium sp. BK049]|uniref:helix-turn-helix transcriptional regulator n=1 Tax=Rhizobium sp. BK049 TaxID=2587095 RepID=UPI001611F6FB|nr:LuxR family transcriptional regulator [Rhizobium sp. BK049]MBB3354163.1 DNA-binding CsgD family transcriptional regulator [Rhizobium sp. BK049]